MGLTDSSSILPPGPPPQEHCHWGPGGSVLEERQSLLHRTWQLREVKLIKPASSFSTDKVFLPEGLCLGLQCTRSIVSPIKLMSIPSGAGFSSSTSCSCRVLEKRLVWFHFIYLLAQGNILIAFFCSDQSKMETPRNSGNTEFVLISLRASMARVVARGDAGTRLPGFHSGATPLLFVWMRIILSHLHAFIVLIYKIGTIKSTS